jgi:plastocyanin
MKQASLVVGIAVFVVLGCVSAAWPRRAGAARTDGQSSGVTAVKIDNFTFGPAAVKIAAGTTVTWTNKDDVPHTVVADDKTTFKSKALDTDEQFSYTFSKPGTYHYFCSVHPKMTGEIDVQ